MNIIGILLIIAVSTVAHAATVRYDGKGTDSKKSQGPSEFQATKPSVVETSSRSMQEDMHLAQLKLQSNQIENSRIHNNNKLAYQSEISATQGFHSQDHFATDSPSHQDFKRDQNLFHSQQAGLSATTGSSLQSTQSDKFNGEYSSFQPESYNDQRMGHNQQFYNIDQQQQFYSDKERTSGNQQFFNDKQGPNEEQFYANNKQSQEQQFYDIKQQGPSKEQFYNDKQQSQEQFYNEKQQAQEQFYNDKQQSQEQFYNDKQQDQFYNDKQQSQEQFYNDKLQDQFYNDKQQSQEQFYNDKEQSQEQFHNDKQQFQGQQQQIFNTMHTMGVEDQRFNSKPFQGISNQQSTQISSGKQHSTQIKTQGVVQLSAFDNREHPIVLPGGAVKSSTVLVSGLKNMPLLPAMVYNAGPVPSAHAIAYSSNPLYKGAAVRQHLQTPYVRYVYSHIL